MRERARISGYIVRSVAAAGVVGVADVTREAISLVTGPGLPPFITFYPMVLVFTFFAGMIPGLVATVLAALATALWIFPNPGSPDAMRPVDAVSLALFVAMGAAAGVVSELYRRARQRNEIHRDDLHRQESDTRARTIVDSAPDSIFIQADGNFVYLNPAGCRLLGVSAPEELIGTRVLDRVHPDYREAVRARISQLNDKREPVPELLELRFLRTDGSEVWVETAGQPVVHDGNNGALVFMRDVSLRKEAERRRAEIENRFALLADTAPVGIAITDLAGRMEYVSPRFVQMVGYTLRDVPTVEEWFRLAYPEERERTRIRREWNEESRRAREYGRDVGPLEYAVRCKDGTVREIEFRISSREDESYVVLADVTDLKQTRDSLRRSQERVRYALEMTRIGTWDLDLTSSTLRRSPVYDAIFGYPTPVAEWTYARFLEHVHPWDRAGVDGDFRRAVERKQDWNREFRIIRADGQLRWVWLAGTPVTGEGGAAGSMAGIAQDITERKTSEQELRESEERFRGTLESMLEGFQLIGSDWRYRYINAAAEGHNRRPRQELLGKRYIDMWPGIESTEVFRVIRTSMVERVPQAMENEFTFPDGSTGWFDLRISPVPEGVAIFSADITTRKRSERELRENQQLLQTVMDLVPHFIFAKDRYSHHLLVNRACAAANDLTPAQMIGHTDLELASDRAQAERFMRDDREVIERNRPKVDIEERLTDRHGRTRVLSTTKMPFTLPGSTERALLGVAVDITELKRAEEQVLQLNADLERRVRERTTELEAANRELESFAYAVSHDLRAPLRAMSGFSQALREDYGEMLDGQAGGYLDQITLASARMGELIDGILQLSRIARGELRRERVDLSSTADQILKDLARAEPDRRVDCRVDPGLEAYGDARLVRAVLQNLLENAWKYTRRADHPAIRLFADTARREPAFSVADNGAGFDMQHQARLFQPFQRLHRQDEFPGIGIGLATVARIVHRHGGTISATGAPGKGAVFTFSLPAEEGPPAPAQELP